MSENRSFRHHPWLEELGSESHDHLVAYLTFLHLRQSSPDTIRVVQSALKMFCCWLPKVALHQHSCHQGQSSVVMEEFS
jgi:hypothetical protein